MRTMSKTQSHPVDYLKNLVCKRGKSSTEGVYYTCLTVTVDIDEDFSQFVPNTEWGEDSAEGLFNGEGLDDDSLNDWNWTLVKIRKSSDGVDVTSIVIRDHLLDFISEDNDLTLKVTIPKLDVSQFAPEALLYRELLKKVSQFACKTPIGLKLSIGAVQMDWDDVVGSGGARKVDVSF